MDDKPPARKQSLAEIYTLFRYLLRKVRKIISALHALNNRLTKLERQCGDCAKRRAVWALGIKEIVVAVASAVLAAALCWLLLGKG